MYTIIFLCLETVFSQPTSIVWKKEPHGEHQIGAFGKRDVLIIRISDKLKSSLVGPAIPRRKGTLTSGDKRMLNTQGIPKECWGDDVQLMEARYRKDAERFDTIITWENASRESTMKKIRDVMNETEKPGGKSISQVGVKSTHVMAMINDSNLLSVPYRNSICCCCFCCLCYSCNPLHWPWQEEDWTLVFC